MRKRRGKRQAGGLFEFRGNRSGDWSVKGLSKNFVFALCNHQTAKRSKDPCELRVGVEFCPNKQGRDVAGCT